MEQLKARISENYAPTPVVEVNRKVDGFFEGTLTAHREVPGEYEKPYQVYNFTAHDLDMTTTVKSADGKYNQIDIKEDAQVSIFAPTRLHNILAEVPMGTKLRIVYKGMVKAGSKGGKAHSFEVFKI
jgi:hypothetical protein